MKTLPEIITNEIDKLDNEYLYKLDDIDINLTCDEDHVACDNLLLELLLKLGCSQVVDKYKQIKKDHNFYYA